MTAGECTVAALLLSSTVSELTSGNLYGEACQCPNWALTWSASERAGSVAPRFRILPPSQKWA